MNAPIGIFGGTFDPVHFGHLRPALELVESCGLGEMHMIPSRIPPHRGLPEAGEIHRWNMLRLALADQRELTADDRELSRPGPSYMVDTLASLRDEYGSVPLCLVLGMDAFLGLPRWHRWREVVALAHLIVMHRPGWSPNLVDAEEPLRDLLAERLAQGATELAQEPAGLVVFQGVTQLGISATAIRALVRAGRSIRYLAPEPVRAYIETEGLYR